VGTVTGSAGSYKVNGSNRVAEEGSPSVWVE
jgi:hypothetical protein